MKENPNGDVKERVVQVATALFSEKGYDGTKMMEIAQGAEVNKALIYYYFPSKQSIMDHIVDNFFNEITGIGLDFTQNTIHRYIEEGKMDILPDRMHFFDIKDARGFYDKILEYYKNSMQFMQSRRDVLRIILAEALRAGEQHGALFRFFQLYEASDNNPIFRAISKADADFTYTTDVVFRKFFFSMIPMINFVVFFEDYKAVSGLGDDIMLSSYRDSLLSMFDAYIIGQDIMLEVNATIKDSVND